MARRKDLVVPDVLTLDQDAAWHENRRRMALLLITFLGLSAAEGVVIGLLADALLIALPVAVGLGFAYLVSGVRYGDTWMQAALAASPHPPAFASALLEGVCSVARVPQPALLVGPGDTPNALALGLGRRWILLTPGATRLERLELEAVLAHEVVHLRDGDAALATAYIYLAGAPDLAARAIHSPRGFLAFLAVPLWPACLLLRLLRPWLFKDTREHRADVAGSLVIRYPPGMRRALEAASVEQGTARFGMTDPFWFAPRTAVRGPGVPQRAARVAEM